jgi:lactobin A/cerein 7B family class IIb bacteriocin
MNVHATTAIRELTAEELDQVNGGVFLESLVISWMVGSAVLGVAGFIDWLFGD